jgi:hypothetical protein
VIERGEVLKREKRILARSPLSSPLLFRLVPRGERILRIFPDEISRIEPLNRRAPLSPRPLPVADDGERVPKAGEGFMGEAGLIQP